MHHANVLIGSGTWGLTQIPLREREEGADVLIKHYERMSIADVRALTYEAGLRPIARQYRTFILICDSLLHEAQNALLKLFEEPNEHTLFFLVIPRESMLLPTLRSRLNFFAQENPVLTTEHFEVFYNMTYADRLSCIAEKLKNEDTEWMFGIISGFVAHAHQLRDSHKMHDALTLESYLYAAGASKKMLLEHLALTLETD